ncbi:MULTISPECIES: metalloregulator ArsR/SmtB family transcription factor [Desulfosporosinus]|uniref:HTH-type transcriptional repressor SmtB n=1 Tax=Desulfosporosinus acididurans TaxID=476652 RepID=A0A0J1FM22_9FIRM|nr:MULTISPECIES: metalloregulator ArsR/SmtB family transcription factor [Desulfosporosinus]KLU64427.1 HTH-type transcriptional repressor SmtB [Desulfosporosinus acididurans]
MNQIELSAKVLKALGHPIRYKIVKFLLDEPKCVCKLTEDVEFSQSNLSQHLKILKEAGLLVSERVGLNVHYRISNEKVKSIIKLTDDFAIAHIKSIQESIT